jgi:6-phosphofructokinase
MQTRVSERINDLITKGHDAIFRCNKGTTGLSNGKIIQLLGDLKKSCSFETGTVVRQSAIKALFFNL